MTPDNDNITEARTPETESLAAKIAEQMRVASGEADAEVAEEAREQVRQAGGSGAARIRLGWAIDMVPESHRARIQATLADYDRELREERAERKAQVEEALGYSEPQPWRKVLLVEIARSADIDLKVWQWLMDKRMQGFPDAVDTVLRELEDLLDGTDRQ